jgi:rhamnulokinase
MMLDGVSWSKQMLSLFRIEKYVPRIVETGTVLGNIIIDDLPSTIQIIAGAGHDTAAAAACIPDPSAVFLSCGTWSLMGMFTDQIIISNTALNLGFTNQRTVDGKNRFMKGFSALWILQQCEAVFGISADDAMYLAEKAQPFQRFINPLSKCFFAKENMPEQIQSYLRATEQKICPDTGSMARCILESIAFQYRRILDQLREITGISHNTIHMLGGGVRNPLLCKFTASATGCQLVKGSSDSSAMGNGLVQLKALGEISFADFAPIINRSLVHQECLPKEQNAWNENYPRFIEICSRGQV